MTNETRIKVINRFLSPLTNRLTEIDQEINVPMNIFWLKRLQVGDCQKVKSKEKLKSKVLNQSKNYSKGSK